jgi:hypothetical protein
MGTQQSNEGAQRFFDNLGNAITSDLGAPGALANGISNLLSNGLTGLILPIALIGGIYIISQKF